MNGDAVRVLVNGKPGDSLSTLDRGLLYGDGLFESIAVENGQPRNWHRHLQRLQSGCERLGMETVDAALLLRECRQLLGQSRQAVIKIIITRGSGGRGYRIPGQPCPVRIIQLHDWPDFPPDCTEYGVRTRMCQTRLGRNISLAGIKHLNRLEQVLARQEWDDDSIKEGLMLDTGGYLVEGTQSNVFLIKDDVLITPDLQYCGVSGIMRARVLEVAAQHSIATSVQPVEPATLLQADEIFVCNSLIGIWPVTGVDEHAFRKGPVTARLQSLLVTLKEYTDSAGQAGR